MDLIGGIAKIASRIAVSSVINPLLWLCAVVALPSIFGAIFSEGSARIVFFIFVAVIIVAVIVAFGYFMFKDPSYLRSERFQIQQQSLAILGDKDNRLQATAANIQAINNPALPSPNPETTEI